MRDKKAVGKLTLLSLFLAYALVMSAVERLIPFEFVVPGVKLGLANVVVLTSLYLFRFGDTLKIVLFKCIISGLLFGSVFTFVYSLAGSLLSFLVMYALIRLTKGRFSALGISVCGAVAHNVGQLLAASAFLANAGIFAYLPVLLVSGVITGVLVGIAVKYSLRYIRVHLSVVDRNGVIEIPEEP